MKSVLLLIWWSLFKNGMNILTEFYILTFSYKKEHLVLDQRMQKA